jgi:2-(1,2-epoxy-1,2-dihydrophenyl)acetyl-CoA isomerase
MTGEFVAADEAYRIGLVNRVVADGEALAAAQSMAERLARGPANALTHTKRALDREAAMDLAAALDVEARVQAALMREPDFREAYEAFRDKRAPRFS